MLHHFFQFSCNAQLVVNHDVTNVFNAAFKFFTPDRRACQSFRRHDVVDEEAIDVANRSLFVDIGGEQFCMAWFRAAVPAHVKVVSVLGCNQPDVFALRLRAFPRATGNGHLYFMR